MMMKVDHEEDKAEDGCMDVVEEDKVVDQEKKMMKHTW